MADSGKKNPAIVSKRRSQREFRKIFVPIACMVALLVGAAFMLPAISMTHGDLVCDMEEHAHSKACYEQVLVCGMEEGEGADPETGEGGHEHTKDCYEKQLVCKIPEHEHIDACYAQESANNLTGASEDAENNSVEDANDSNTTPNTGKDAGKSENINSGIESAQDDNQNENINQNQESSLDTASNGDMPAQDFEADLKDADGNVAMTVRVEAPKGALPAGANMKIDGVDPYKIWNQVAEGIDKDQKLGAALDGRAARDAMTRLTAVDIVFKDADGNEISAAKKCTIKIASNEVRIIEKPVLIHALKNENSKAIVSSEVVRKVKRVNADEKDESIGNENTLKFKAREFGTFAIVELAAPKASSEGATPVDEALLGGEGVDAQGESAGGEALVGTAGETASEPAPEAPALSAQQFSEQLKDEAGNVSLSVSVDAPEGSLPEGATMKVKPVTKTSVLDAAKDKAAAETAIEASHAQAAAVDITFYNAGGEPVEPTADVHVVLSVPAAVVKDELAVVHMPDGEVAEVVETTATDAATATAEFDSANFSVYALVYTVDFHYEIDGKMYDFSIPGGGFVSLEHVVEALGIVNAGSYNKNDAEDAKSRSEKTQQDGAEDGDAGNAKTHSAADLNALEISEESRKFVGDVESVKFSSPEMAWVGKADVDSTVGGLKVSNGLACEYSADLTEEQIAEINALPVEAGDWVLISMLPFDTDEILTVTMKDGEVFTIKVTDAQLKKTVISASGEAYEITVTYGEDAQIPDGAELVVREIHNKEDGYSDLFEKAAKKAREDAQKQGIEIPLVAGARLFDIEIHDAEGKVQPKARVRVDIRLAGEKADLQSVIHFAKDGAEAMELQDIPAKSKVSENVEEVSEDNAEGLSKEVCFAADSFSVYTVVDVNSANLADDGPYVLATGIQGDPGADVGYQENWGKDFFTKVVNGMAMTNEDREHGLSSIGVHVWVDGSQGFVGGEATQWTFEQGDNGNYYIKDGSGNYLKWSSYTTSNYFGGTDTHYDGMSLSNNKSEATQFAVTPTSDNDGSVYLTFAYQGATWYLHNNQYSGTNEWSSRNYMVRQNPSADEMNSSAYKFKLCKQSNEYDSFAATKISSKQVTTDENYVIYHKFQDSEGNEELYALASDGTFVRVYDGGDRVYWRETDKNIYWNYQAGDGHHLMSVDPATNQQVYLNPIASGEGQTISSEDHYLTLNGKDNDEYGTTIERWDQASYDYAGLHVVKDGNTIRLEPGTRNGGTSDEFLFARASSMPDKATKEPVATLDSDALGIKITMFDYGEADNAYSAGHKLPEMTEIAGSDAYTPHAAHSLVKPYLVSGLPANNSGDAMTGLFETGGAITGTVENVNHLFLQSYYDENGTFRYRSEDNYAYIPLGGTGGGTNDFTVYSQVATPYTSDRQVGHPYYYHGHFMPFNDIDMNNHLSRLLDQYGTQEIPLEDGRTYEDVYGITGTPNYYTGMKMEAIFIQPSNGVLENGDDMVFKFTGDDDMWVYIDGILVLDIGGIHEPLSGTINFRTGEVTNPDGSSLAGKRTLYDIFMGVYNDPNTPQEVKDKISAIEWNGGTFADFTTHSFGAFYMERGAGASNLDLQFNLKIAKTDEFVVRKKLPESVDDRFVNQRFKYQVTYKDTTELDETKQVKPLYKGAKNHDGTEVCMSVTYKDRRDPATGQPITVEVPVDNNGYFYLFPGEAAVFKVDNETIEYDVKEVTIDQTLIKQVDINNKKDVDIVDDTSVPANGKIADAEFAQVIDRGEVVYTNHPQTQNLLITKHLSTDSAPLEEGEMPVFEFRVYLEAPVKDGQGNVTVDQQGKPITKLIPYSYGPYYLMKDGEYYTLTGENNAPVRQGTTPVICSTTGRSGSINSIPLEYTIVIPDIAVGTHFYLEERRDNIPQGYEFVEEKLTPETYDPEVLYTGNPDAQVIERILARDEGDEQEFDPSTIGRIKNGTDAESHVYNRKPAIDVPVEKQWVPASNTPESVTLALIRYKAPDQNQHQTVEGKGAILIHHYADYGNGNEALPSGFRATYKIVDKASGQTVFEGTGDRTYDVDPGEYTVTTTVTNWGNVPSNFAPNESESAHTTDVTVAADQSTTAILKSKYEYVPNGTISLSHKASYIGGMLSDSTELPDGFRATYSIKDNATGQYVYTNVAAGEYDVAPGTYTVTARISSIAAPQDYYYQNTTTDENAVVTSGNKTTVTLTSTYEYREAPPVDGRIKFSHVSAGLPDTTGLPGGFQANIVIEGPAKTIENAVADQTYDVPPGDYQIYVKQIYNNGSLPDGYFYTKTEPITVTVSSAQDAFDNTLTSTYGQGGYLTIAHQSQGINGTSPNMPNDFSAGYTIRNKATGEVVREHAVVGTEYALPPGEYTVEMAQIYSEGQHQNHNYVSTDTATVTVRSGDRETATLTSTYERMGGNNTDVYLCVAYSPNDSDTHITVPINSEVTLNYQSFYSEAWHQQINPNWELYYWNGNSWIKVDGVGGVVPGNQGVDIPIGEEGKYCVLINTDPSFAENLEASITPKTRSTQSTVNASTQLFALNNPALIGRTATQLNTDLSEASSNTGFIMQDASIMKSLSGLATLKASTSKLLRGDAASASARDMTAVEVQGLTIPDTFVIPNTYTLDKDFGKMLTLTNPWKYTFEGLPENDKNGNEYYYAIVEVEVPEDYAVSYSPQQPVKASDIRANMLARAAAEADHQILPELLTLTAINTTTAVEGDLQVTKTVKLNGENDSSHGGADLTFYVGLFESEAATVAMQDTVKPITVQNGSAVGTVAYSNLRVGSRYFVYETDAQGNKLAVNQKTNGYIVTANGGQSDPITVTPVVNVDIVNEKRTGDLELTKNVTGAGADTTKQFEFTIELTPPTGEALATSYPAEHSNDSTVMTATIAESKVTGIKLKQGETYTIKNLPEGTTFKITEADYSQLGYTSSISNGEGRIDRGSAGKVTVTATNTYKSTQVTVKKVDVSNLDKESLAEGDLLKGAAFKITKYQDKNFQGIVTGWGSSGSIELADVKNGDLYSLSGVFTFTSLPEGFYTIEETAFPDGYVRLGSIPRFEIGADMKVYLLDENGNRIAENKTGILKVLPIAGVQTDNVVIFGNTPGTALPHTGGSGIIPFNLFGTMLTAIAGAWMFVMRKKRNAA